MADDQRKVIPIRRRQPEPDPARPDLLLVPHRDRKGFSIDVLDVNDLPDDVLDLLVPFIGPLDD